MISAAPKNGDAACEPQRADELLWNLFSTRDRWDTVIYTCRARISRKNEGRCEERWTRSAAAVRVTPPVLLA
ncbi:MAG: hypothetical protein HUU20_07480 [Pirellulales bacterium]|nr:hypothetical protein [Pirellulales bacterium]